MLREGATALNGPLATLAIDPFAFDAALSTLLRFSLVHRCTDSTTVHMHRLVQITLREHLTKRQRLRFAKQAVRLINTIFPEVGFATRSACARYALQAQHCATLIRDFQLTLQEGVLLLERLGSTTPCTDATQQRRPTSLRPCNCKNSVHAAALWIQRRSSIPWGSSLSGKPTTRRPKPLFNVLWNCVNVSWARIIPKRLRACTISPSCTEIKASINARSSTHAHTSLWKNVRKE